jgi:hypothetical protein
LESLALCRTELDKRLELDRSGKTGGGIYPGCGLRGRSFRHHQKGGAELRDLHKFFHNAVSGLYVELVDSHVADRHGTIEWVFGGTDVDVFKTGKPCSVRGVSVIEVSDGRISRNLDYYDAAAIMRQVGVLPEQKNDRRG